MVSKRVAILGAGPIGMEAALAAVAAGHDPVVYERGPGIGAGVRRWGHVRTFTPWSMTVSPRARAALGETAPDGPDLPTGNEIVERLLEPLAGLPQLAGRIHARTAVTAVGRAGLLKHEEIGSAARAARPFRLLLRDEVTGEERVDHARVVIDATGVSGTPNRMGDGGIDAIGERRFEERIDRHLVDLAADHAGWAGRTILLTGAGHSAQTAARDLADFAARAGVGTRVIWAIRAARPSFGAVPGDTLAERAALNATARELAAGASTAVEVRTGVVTEALTARGDRLEVTLRNGDTQRVVVDRILALNGGVGDASIYRQLQVHECYASLGPMKLAATLGDPDADCLAGSVSGPEALRNPEPGFFILGAKSYGRNPQFLLRTGWQQVDDVFGALLAG